MYTGNKSCNALSSSKSSQSYIPGNTNSVGTTHYEPKRKQRYQEQVSCQYSKPIEGNGTKIKKNKVVAKQSIIHKSLFIQHTNHSTIMNPNAMSSNTKIDTGCNLRGTTSKCKSSTQHTNVSAIKKNSNSSLKNCTLKTNSNVRYTTSKLKLFTIVSTTKNPNTVSELNKRTQTPSRRGTTGKGACCCNSSFPSNGSPTAQCHLKEHNTLKSIKERSKAPKGTSTG